MKTTLTFSNRQPDYQKINHLKSIILTTLSMMQTKDRGLAIYLAKSLTLVCNPLELDDKHLINRCKSELERLGIEVGIEESIDA